MVNQLYTNNSRPSWADVKVRARGHWPAIHRAAGIDEQYRGRKHSACPVCQAGKDRYRFTNWNDDGGYYCNVCGYGDGFQLLQQVCNLTQKQSLDFVANWLGLKGFDSVQPRINSTVTTAKNNDNQSDAELRAKAKYLWDSGSSVQAGDTVDLYLSKRGIRVDKYPEGLRFHPKLKHHPQSPDERTTYPGMLAKLTAPDGTFGGCLRTFLLETGAKALGRQSKKFMRGTIPKGSAIRLYEPTDILGISEGIETGLICHLGLNLPVWATTGTAFMEKVIIPAEVKEVVILADHDECGAGLKSAHMLARRMIKENRRVKILLPPITGDWLNVVTDDLK